VSEIKYKYCVKKGDTVLYTDDLALVQQLLGLETVLFWPTTGKQMKLERVGGPYPIIRYYGVSQEVVKNVFQRIIRLAKEKPVTSRQLKNAEPGLSWSTVRRALRALAMMGKVRVYRGKGGIHMYIPAAKTFEGETIGDVTLTEEQKRKLEHVGKSLKEEWRIREGK